MAITELIQQLQDLIIRLRSQLDQAEAHLPALNNVIARLAELSLIPERTLLGHIVHMRDYEPGTGIIDSGMVLQAALRIPDGLGIVVWDTEQYTLLRNSPQGLEGEVVMRFFPFAELDPPLKALILPHTESLLERVIRMAIPFQSPD